jgi:hypothetical protein
MRHLRVLTIQVLLLTLGVVLATLERGLVPLPGSLQGRLPPLLRAVVATVPVAPIAGRTDHHGPVAPGAIKLSVSQIDRRVHTARLDHRGEIGDALLMRLSLIAAAASGGPEQLLRASTFHLLRSSLSHCDRPSLRPWGTTTARSDGTAHQAATRINNAWSGGIGGT